MLNTLKKLFVFSSILFMSLSCSPSMCDVIIKNTTDDPDYSYTIQVPHGQVLPEINVPERTGYTFKCWTHNGTEWPKDRVVENHIIIHAKFEANKYPITYVLPEGSINYMFNPTYHEYGYATTVYPPSYIPNHTFKEWVDQDGNVVSKIEKYDTNIYILEAIVY